MDGNIKTIEEQNTIIDNNDNKLKCTLRAIWFRLLIDKKMKLMYFKLKEIN